MAFLKFGFLLFSALLVLQVNATPLENVEAPTQLAKVVKDLVVAITTLLGRVIDAVEKVDNFVTKTGLDNVQKETVNVTLHVLTAVKKFFDKELDEIQPNLNADGKIISKCLESNGMEIVNLIVSYYDKVSKCANPAIKTLLTSYLPLLEDLKKVDDNVAKTAPMLDKCQNDACVIAVITQILRQASTLPKIVHDDLPAIEKAVGGLLRSAITCAQTEAADWKKESYSLFNKVSTCFRQK